MPYWSLDCGRVFPENAIAHAPIAPRLSNLCDGNRFDPNEVKVVAKTKPARNIYICEKFVWHLGHRIRTASTKGSDRLLIGPVEIEETYLDGTAQNRHAS